METINRVRVLVVATVIIWLSVVVVGQIDGTEFVQGAAAILAIISTMTIWSLWALDAYGISVDGTPREKVTHPRRAGCSPVAAGGRVGGGR